MRIGIDYRPAWAHAPGVGRYVRELVRALVQLPAPPELALYELGDQRRELADDELGLAQAHAIATRLRGPIPRRLLRGLGRLGLGADRLLGGVELFQQTDPTPVPVRYARQCTAVAELPLPGTAAAREHAAWLRSMDGLLVFSAEARRRLIEDCAIDPGRIHHTPVGCEHWRRQLRAAGSSAQAPAEEPDRYRLVALGALHRERRPSALLAACELLRDRGLQVELVHLGRHGDAADAWLAQRADSPAGEAVQWIEDPTEAKLIEHVARADVLVHLAREELTPVTVLEACSLGPAVVADRLPALEEALGGLAEWVEPGTDSAEQLADAVAAACARSRVEEERAARRALAERYDWRGCALATSLAWRRVCAGSTSQGAAPPRK